MTRTTLRAKGQLTLPDDIRKAAHLETGDLLEAELTPDGILLRPQKLIDATQTWFWTPEWQAGERRAAAAGAAGGWSCRFGGRGWAPCSGWRWSCRWAGGGGASISQVVSPNRAFRQSAVQSFSPPPTEGLPPALTLKKTGVSCTPFIVSQTRSMIWGREGGGGGGRANRQE